MSKLNFEIRKEESGNRPIRRNVLFFIVVGVSAFVGVWIIAKGWESDKAGTNLNWFHEFLGLFLLFLWCGFAYKELYQQSEVFLLAKAEKEELERKAKEEAHAQMEARKASVFKEFIRVFQVANTFEEKNAAMVDLLKVGLESQLLRQQVLDLVMQQNAWMADHEIFLSTQNLFAWRVKNELFEVSPRFDIDSETQDLSIKTINMAESIIKRHLDDYTRGVTTKALDLSGKIVPTLNLAAIKIPEGALVFDKAYLWHASFSETEIFNISFAKTHLQAASFWKAKMVNIDLQEAYLENTKMRTDIQQVKNLTADQFFSTKEWELAFISKDQTNLFFPTQEEGDPHWDKWMSEATKRDRLYFNKEQLDKLKKQIKK